MISGMSRNVKSPQLQGRRRFASPVLDKERCALYIEQVLVVLPYGVSHMNYKADMGVQYVAVSIVNPDLTYSGLQTERIAFDCTRTPLLGPLGTLNAFMQEQRLWRRKRARGHESTDNAAFHSINRFPCRFPGNPIMCCDDGRISNDQLSDVDEQMYRPCEAPGR